MASITIRRLDAELKRQLRLRAARHGRSMEDEARTILRDAAAAPALSGGGGQGERHEADVHEAQVPDAGVAASQKSGAQGTAQRRPQTLLPRPSRRVLLI